MGADVILSPSSWAVRPDHNNDINPYGKEWLDAYMPVASEFSVWIASIRGNTWMNRFELSFSKMDSFKL